jgi:type IV secretion system protein VirB11
MQNDILQNVCPQIWEQLRRDDIRDVCVNYPGMIFTDTKNGWESIDAPELTIQQLMMFANAVCNFNKMGLTESNPIMSGGLPTGERIQIVVPGVVEKNHISITIRRPSDQVWPIDELAAKGTFEHLGHNINNRAAQHRAAKEKYALAQSTRLPSDWVSFFRFIVESKFNLVFSGPMGSGKTTFLKACLRLIPLNERIGSIEDARETSSPDHKNIVYMLYSRGNTSIANVTAADLLTSSLRQKFSRILLSEIRAGEAFFFVMNIFSGHPGSMSTIHANSAKEARQMIALRCAQSEEGRSIPTGIIRDLVDINVDVVVQCNAMLVPGSGYQHYVEDVSFANLE